MTSLQASGDKLLVNARGLGSARYQLAFSTKTCI